jgi:hypothetical protein
MTAPRTIKPVPVPIKIGTRLLPVVGRPPGRSGPPGGRTVGCSGGVSVGATVGITVDWPLAKPSDWPWAKRSG